jgi:hypothetical protein
MELKDNYKAAIILFAIGCSMPIYFPFFLGGIPPDNRGDRRGKR